MTHWKCSNYEYAFEAEAPPDNCPSCNQTCTFSDVICYIPEYRPGNIDPKLVGKKEKPVTD